MLTASDLAGLNPEDIQAVLGSQFNATNLMSKNISDVYSRDLENRKLKQEAGLTLMKLQTQGELNKMDNEARKELAKLGFDNDKALLTMKLNDPNAIAELNANIGLANARARQVKAEEDKTRKEIEILDKTGGVKTKDLAELELSKKRLEATLKKDKLDQMNDLRKAEFDLGSDYSDIKKAGDISYINTLSDKPEYIYQWKEPGKIFGSNVKGEKLPLPIINYNGKPLQIKAKDVAETALANGISEKEVLKQLGVLDDDFRPIKNK